MTPTEIKPDLWRNGYDQGYKEGKRDAEQSIPQAIAEERERGRKAWIQGNVISYSKPTYQSAFFEAEEVVILSSLDTNPKNI